MGISYQLLERTKMKDKWVGGTEMDCWREEGRKNEDGLLEGNGWIAGNVSLIANIQDVF